jgi:uncharacterized membrane protein YbhN (UPF0104 family)
VKVTWRKVAGAAVAIVLLAFMVRALRSGLADLGSYQFDISPLRIAGAFGVFAVLFPVYGILWQYLVARFGYPLPFGRSLKVWLLSEAGKYVPGKVWFALGRIYLNEREGVPKSVTTVATAIELALVLASSLVVFAVAWAATGSSAGRPYVWMVLVAPVVVAAVHPRVIAPVLKRLRKGETRLDLRYRDILMLLGAYCLCWCLYGVGFYLVATGVSVTGSGAPAHGAIGLGHLPEMIGINALAWTAGLLSIITPAGLGVREGVAFSLLSKTVPRPYPSLIPLVVRVWVTIAEVAAIGIAAAAAARGKR